MMGTAAAEELVESKDVSSTPRATEKPLSLEQEAGRLADEEETTSSTGTATLAETTAEAANEKKRSLDQDEASKEEEEEEGQSSLADAAGAAGAAAQYKKRPKVEIPPGMSKSQWKKQQRKQLWDSRKEEIKKQRREKRKEDKQRKRAQVGQLLAEGHTIEEVREMLNLKTAKQKTNPDQVDSGVSVIYDCSFDEMMKETELVSMITQIGRSYGENRRAQQYINMKVSSFKGLIKERFDEKAKGYENWQNIEFVSKDLEELLGVEAAEATEAAEAAEAAEASADGNTLSHLDIDKTIYLSADEPTESLETLEAGYTYIIGGIVDKGRYKSLCYDKAKRLGLKTARLPIDEFIKISGRRVLTTLHVFMLLSKWMEVKDWRRAFEEVLPERKVMAEEEDEDEDEEETQPERVS